MISNTSSTDHSKFLLQQPNPFEDSVVGDIWQDIIDVPEINQAITEKIYETVQQVQDLKLNRIFLMLGGPGSGKTHVLARIQRQAEKVHKFLFVYIKPIGDIAKVNQHILRELMVSLLKQVGQRSLTPLIQYTTVILSRAIIDLQKRGNLPQEYLPYVTILARGSEQIETLCNEIQKMKKDGQNRLFDLAISNIVGTYPQVDATFLRVLFQLLDPTIRHWAQDWLKGIDLPEDDLKNLRVTQSLDSEDRASEVLQSIFTLAQGPILLCVDQLESVYERFKDQDGIKLLFDHLMNYYNQFKNLMIVLACNLMYWSEYIQKSISQAAQDRISIRDSLRSLSREEAGLLVGKRMQPIWAKSPTPVPYPTYPFAVDYIDYVAKNSGWNPRGIIQRLRDAFDQLKKSTPILELHPPVTTPVEEKIPIEVEPIESDLSSGLQGKLDAISKEIYTKEISTISSPEWEDQVTGFLTDLFKECFSKHTPFIGGVISKFAPNIKKTKSQKPLSFSIEIQQQSEEKSEPTKQQYLIHITNTTNGTSLSSFLKRMKEYLLENPNWKGVLIRSEKLDIEGRFPASQRTLEEMSGRLLVSYFPDHQISLFLALKKMLESASGGDLQVNNHLVTRAEVMEFIFTFLNQRDLFGTTFPDLGKGFTPPVTPPTKPIIPEKKVPDQRKEKEPPKPTPASDLLQKVLKIARSKAIVNANQLVEELGIDIQKITSLCQYMEKQGLITILNVKTESGFLIAPKPTKSIL